MMRELSWTAGVKELEASHLQALQVPKYREHKEIRVKTVGICCHFQTQNHVSNWVYIGKQMLCQSYEHRVLRTHKKEEIDESQKMSSIRTIGPFFARFFSDHVLGLNGCLSLLPTQYFKYFSLIFS
jgi:desulfoferrodoxin (superoxide reductase-like protein)